MPLWDLCEHPPIALTAGCSISRVVLYRVIEDAVSFEAQGIRNLNSLCQFMTRGVCGKSTDNATRRAHQGGE
jgi:hypothetical protein